MKEFRPLQQYRFKDFGNNLERRYGFLPYSDLKQWTPNDGFVEDALSNLQLERLRKIKALSFLSYIGHSTETNESLDYTHNRFDHSFIVGLVCGEMLRRNGYPQNDIKIGITSGLVHDKGLPAYGDAAKKVDPDALDEEASCWESLGERGQAFVKSVGMSQETLEPIIRNEGIFGQVLDVADRIVYTMQDLHATLSGTERDKTLSLTLDQHLLPIRYLLSRNHHIGNIYKEVGIDRKKQKVFFNNPKHLQMFLFLRAHLHQVLYLNPINQGRDLFVKQLLEPMYSRRGDKPLSPTVLRSMTDEGLLTALQKYHQASVVIPDDLYYQLTNWSPSFKKFQSHKEAKKFEQELKSEKSTVIIDKPYPCKGFNPGTSYNVINEKGEIEPLREFDPVAVKEIEDVAESTKGVFVFYANITEDNSINNLLKNVLRKK